MRIQRAMVIKQGKPLILGGAHFSTVFIKSKGGVKYTGDIGTIDTTIPTNIYAKAEDPDDNQYWQLRGNGQCVLIENADQYNIEIGSASDEYDVILDIVQFNTTGELFTLIKDYDLVTDINGLVRVAVDAIISSVTVTEYPVRLPDVIDSAFANVPCGTILDAGLFTTTFDAIWQIIMGKAQQADFRYMIKAWQLDAPADKYRLYLLDNTSEVLEVVDNSLGTLTIMGQIYSENDQDVVNRNDKIAIENLTGSTVTTWQLRVWLWAIDINGGP